MYKRQKKNLTNSQQLTEENCHTRRQLWSEKIGNERKKLTGGRINDFEKFYNHRVKPLRGIMSRIRIAFESLKFH